MTLATTTREAVRLCTLAERESVARQLRRVLARSVDWDGFWEIAAYQEVLPLVARTLLDDNLAGMIPESCVRDARTLLDQTTFVNLSLDAELRRVCRTLHCRDVPVVPLKGTHLARRLYGSVGLRRAGDIDVLVPEGTLEIARGALRELGYSPATSVADGDADHSFHGLPYVRPGLVFPFVVELHWKLSDPRYVSIDYPRLWDRIHHIGGDARRRGLPGEDLLLFLALHRFKHDNGSLRLLADVDRLVRRERSTFDWTYVVAEAKRWGAAGALYFALLQAQSLLQTPLPEAILADLAPARWRRWLVEVLAGSGSPLRATPPSSARSNRCRLAYCLMLTPLSRTVDAYARFLFPAPRGVQSGIWGDATVKGRRLLGGIARTGVVLASSVVDR